MSLGMIYACIKPQIEVLGSSYLDLLKMLGKKHKYYPKSWFDGDLLWDKVKNHLKQIHGSVFFRL